MQKQKTQFFEYCVIRGMLSLKYVSIYFNMNGMPVSKQINNSRGGFYGQNQPVEGCQGCLEEKVNSEVELPTRHTAVFTL